MDVSLQKNRLQPANALKNRRMQSRNFEFLDGVVGWNQNRRMSQVPARKFCQTFTPSTNKTPPQSHSHWQHSGSTNPHMIRTKQKRNHGSQSSKKNSRPIPSMRRNPVPTNGSPTPGSVLRRHSPSLCICLADWPECIAGFFGIPGIPGVLG